MKTFLKIVIVILLLICLAGLAFIYANSVYQTGIGPVNDLDTEPIIVTIPQGTSGYGILNILYNNGLLSNINIGKVFLKLNSYNTLQADTYILNKSMSLNEIFTIINTNDFNYVVKETFTVPEGLTIPEAADKIASQLSVTKAELLSLWSDKTYLNELLSKYSWMSDAILSSDVLYPLEGYLYPDTYILTGEISAKTVTNVMLEQMNKIINARMDKIKATRFTVHELLTLASIVQGESGKFSDMPTIAGVFINRLNVPMRLQSDITVLYGIQKKHVDVTYSEMFKDTPYNTYTRDGLPIAPVCLFSSYAIDGVLDYEKTDYYYFFACEDGTVLYAKTLAEHERNANENSWY